MDCEGLNCKREVEGEEKSQVQCKLMPVMSSSLVVLSGGQDSVTCLYWALKHTTGKVYALTFDYGQRHRKEIECAKKIAYTAGVEHEILTLPDNILAGTSPLTDKSKEVETYDNAYSLPGGLEDTFVPGRNVLFLTLAANRAYVKEVMHLVIGVSQEDFGGYPDCRWGFIDYMEGALRKGYDSYLSIHAPLINLSKRETVLFADDLGILDKLKDTWTCYQGGDVPCGSCHSCLLRIKGFLEAGREDPALI